MFIILKSVFNVWASTMTFACEEMNCSLAQEISARALYYYCSIIIIIFFYLFIYLFCFLITMISFIVVFRGLGLVQTSVRWRQSCHCDQRHLGVCTAGH